MKNWNTIIQEFEKLNLQEIRTQLKTGELTHINMTYNPDTFKLSIEGYKTGISDSKTLRECEISLDTYCAILIGVINNPTYITANLEKPSNVAVEFGAIR